MKRPRPVRSAASSTRSIDWPHQLVVDYGHTSDVPRCALLRHIRGKRCHETAGEGRYRSVSSVTENLLSGADGEPSARDTAEFARVDAGMIAEKSGEMSLAR